MVLVFSQSNVRGLFDTVVTDNYQHTHEGVCQFLQNLAHHYRIVFLTSRPISLSNVTRRFIEGVVQDGTRLPEGALFMNWSNISSVLLSELFLKDMYKYKADIMLRQIILPFAAASNETGDAPALRSRPTSPLVAGFGNSITDTIAYDMAGIPTSKIYQIDKKGNIVCHDNLTESSSGESTPEPTIKNRKRNFSLLAGSRYQGYRDEQLAKDINSMIAAG